MMAAGGGAPPGGCASTAGRRTVTHPSPRLAERLSARDTVAVEPAQGFRRANACNVVAWIAACTRAIYVVVLVILYLHTQPPGLSPSPPPRLLSFNARTRVFVCLFLGFIFCDPIGSLVGCEERGEARVRMRVSEPHLLWGGCRRCSSYVLGGYRRPLPPHQWGVTPPIPTQAQAPQAR